MAFYAGNIGGALTLLFRRILSVGGATKKNITLSQPVSYTTMDLAQVGTVTISASATTNIDLTSLGDDPVGDAVVLAHAAGWWFASSASQVKLDVQLTNGISTWFLEGSNAKLIIPAGGFASIGWTDSTAVVVDGTHKLIRLANTGAVPTTVTWGIIGKST